MAGNKEIQIKLEREYPIPNWTLLNYGTMITFDSIVGVVASSTRNETWPERERESNINRKKKEKATEDDRRGRGSIGLAGPRLSLP